MIVLMRAMNDRRTEVNRSTHERRSLRLDHRRARATDEGLQRGLVNTPQAGEADDAVGEGFAVGVRVED
jgi:hypothetical protein